MRRNGRPEPGLVGAAGEAAPAVAVEAGAAAEEEVKVEAGEAVAVEAAVEAVEAAAEEAVPPERNDNSRCPSR
jgi:hypothetical protein